MALHVPAGTYNTPKFNLVLCMHFEYPFLSTAHHLIQTGLKYDPPTTITQQDILSENILLCQACFCKLSCFISFGSVQWRVICYNSHKNDRKTTSDNKDQLLQLLLRQKAFTGSDGRHQFLCLWSAGANVAAWLFLLIVA